jgi:hypothetical protein
MDARREPMEVGTDLAERDPLVDHDRAAGFRERWEQIQVRFVDEPERSVEEADELVSEVIRDLQDSFAAQREGLERRWQGGGRVSTEDLRVALQGYRSFFIRLLGA